MPPTTLNLRDEERPALFSRALVGAVAVHVVLVLAIYLTAAHPNALRVGPIHLAWLLALAPVALFARRVKLAVQERRAMPGELLGSGLIHGAFAMLLILSVRHADGFRITETQLTEMEVIEPPPPPPPPPPPAPEPPPPPPAPEPPRNEPPPPRNEPPPPPAAAAPPPVLTATPDPQQPVRFDQEIDSMPTGNNTNFQGGDMRSDGTNTTGPAYNSRPGGQPGGTPGGTGTAPPASPRAEDLSERPQIECDENALREFYPEQARDEGISEESVEVRLTVDASGRITEARAVSDPGHGFGRAAERALRNACTATIPRDREGRAVSVPVRYRIRFQLD